MQEKFTGGSYMLEERGQTWIEGFARLKPGVTIDQAESELSGVAKQLETEYPTTNRGRGVKLFPLWKTPFNQAGSLAPTLTLSLVAVFFVLLIACAHRTPRSRLPAQPAVAATSHRGTHSFHPLRRQRTCGRVLLPQPARDLLSFVLGHRYELVRPNGLARPGI
jgi:hypothetical protein